MSEATYPHVSPDLRRGGLADEVAAYVRDLILTGRLRPGVKLNQDAIGEAIGVSRSPIREAIVVLGQEGIVDVTPRRGAFVAGLTPDDIIDHYELYGTVSGRAAAIAADTLKDEQLMDLDEIHSRFRLGTGDDLSVLNDDFHRIINTAAPRRTRWLLRHLVRSVPTAFYEFTEGWDAHAVDDHRRILEALLDRDAEEARTAMEAHLHDSGVAAVESLHARGFWEDAPL